jgi:hypothetical protein
MFEAANLTLRFLLELAALGALGWYGVRTGDSTLAKIALGAGLPLAAAVLWGLFAAPKSTFDVPAMSAAVQVLVFGGAALALLAIHRQGLAEAFAAAVVVNVIALAALGA